MRKREPLEENYLKKSTKSKKSDRFICVINTFANSCILGEKGFVKRVNAPPSIVFNHRHHRLAKMCARSSVLRRT